MPVQKKSGNLLNAPRKIVLGTCLLREQFEEHDRDNHIDDTSRLIRSGLSDCPFFPEKAEME